MVMPSRSAQQSSVVVGPGEGEELSAVSETGSNTARQAVDMVNQTDIPTSLNGILVVKETTPHALTSDHEQNERHP